MNDTRRRLPAVTSLLADAERAGLTASAPRAVVVDAIRHTLAGARARGGQVPAEGWLRAVERRIAERARRSLVPVINATGVVLHTNLGRAPLAASAIEAMRAAQGYSALEFDLDQGTRGSRQRHTQALLTTLTGAEDAVVVGNAAAALLLVLHALADRGETIVSRGELIEIGGGFRIPDILARSGSVLVEVGTTNRTRRADYELAIGARTRCAMKVHQSNFRTAGFVSDVSVTDLVTLFAPRGLPVIHDVGSGLLLDLSDCGLHGEPLVAHSVEAGAVTVFSGDKLLGGPQAGIIAGPAALIDTIATNPLMRALRPDKATIAALEATLELYLEPAAARREVPVLAMLTAPADHLRRRARRLARRIEGASVRAGTSSVGGGAFPDVALPTWLVTIPAASPDARAAALRQHEPPIVVRTDAGAILLDVRTIGDREFGVIADAMAHGV